MRFSTHSHSSPEEHYSNSVRRKLMCAGRIRGFHPQLLDVAKSLHPCPKWRYMRIQQFNAQIIVSNRDLILVHSQWLKAFSVVHFPPLINMLKFGGCASMISCLCMSHIRSCLFNVREMSQAFMLCSAHQNTGPVTTRVSECLICQFRVPSAGLHADKHNACNTYAVCECCYHWDRQTFGYIPTIHYALIFPWIHGIVQFTMCITSRCILRRIPNQHINRYMICKIGWSNCEAIHHL